MKKLVPLTLLPVASLFARAPAFNILGSYFPAWILCSLIGILLAALLAFIVRRSGRVELFEPTLVTYPCLAVSIACLLWLFLFS